LEIKHEIKCYTLKDDIILAMNDIQAVAKKTYLYALGEGCKYSDELQKKWSFLCSKNMLKLYVLYIEAKPRSFCVFYHYKNVLYSMGTGYDPDFSNYRIGSILLIHIITQCCLDPFCKLIDYGLGDEQYKQIFGNESTTVINFMLFSSTLKGQLIKLFRLITIGSTQLAKKILIRLKVIKFFKCSSISKHEFKKS